MDIANTLTGKSLAKYFGRTLLEAYATEIDFEKLCKEAKKPGATMVATNSTQARVCKELLKGCDMHVGAAVSFPLGQTALEIKVEEIKKTMQNGSDEIDYVINIGGTKMKHWDYIEEEMCQIVGVYHTHKVISKVIFENCYLEKEEIKKLTEVARKAKPDYIKTSIGFGTDGATLGDVRLMEEIAGDDVKVGAAGSVCDWGTCKATIEAGAERIGTSSSITILEGF